MALFPVLPRDKCSEGEEGECDSENAMAPEEASKRMSERREGEVSEWGKRFGCGGRALEKEGVPSKDADDVPDCEEKYFGSGMWGCAKDSLHVMKSCVLCRYFRYCSAMQVGKASGAGGLRHSYRQARSLTE